MKKIIKISLISLLLINIKHNIEAQNTANKNRIGLAVGIGNPIISLLVSFPYIDLEIGYGGSNGIFLTKDYFMVENKYNLEPFVNLAGDFIYKFNLIENIDMGLGIGMQSSLAFPQMKTEYVEIDLGLRLPITISYKINDDFEVYSKFAPSLEFMSNFQSLVRHKFYGNLKLAFMGGIFIKLYT